MPQFHETGYGRTFFEHQLPELIKAINGVAEEMRKLREYKEEEEKKAEKELERFRKKWGFPEEADNDEG